MLDSRSAVCHDLSMIQQTVLGMTMTEGRIGTMLVAEEAMLYVWRTDEMADGGRWLAVYRSPVVRDDEQWLGPYRDLLAAGPLHSEVVTDPIMVFGQAELSIYEI